MSKNVQLNYWDPIYPKQPGFNGRCGLNEIYKTLPEGIEWETLASGPASIKHLYSGIPNWYPIRKITRPVGTLYERDLSMYEAFGKRMTYQYKVYPLTHRNVREVREYEDYILPYMDFRNWTKHPIRNDESLNGWQDL